MIFGSTSDAAMASERAERAAAMAAHEQARKQNFSRRWLALQDDIADLVRERVRQAFKDSVQAARIAAQSDTTLNAFRWVIEEIYSHPGARRRFVLDDVVDASTSEVVERTDPTFASLEIESGLDLVAAEWARGAGGCNDVLVQALPRDPSPDNPRGLPYLRVFYPHEVSVTPDPADPSMPLEVRYDVLREDGERVVGVWTKELHYVEGRGGPVPPRGATGVEHGLGFLPFVAVHYGPRPDSFWDTHTHEGLLDFTLDYCAGWADIKHIVQQQSYKQLVVKGLAESHPGFTTSGPGVHYRCGTDVTVDAIDMTADTSGAKQVLESRAVQKLRSYGINAERLLGNPGQAPPSGAARLIEKGDIEKRRRDVRPFVMRAERAVAELWRRAWNWGHPRQQIGGTFRATLLDEPFIQSPLEDEQVREKRLANWRAELELGLRTQAEVFAEARGLSVEQAQVALAARQTESQQTVLNGAQVAAITTILEGVSSGTIQPENAMAVLMAAFPLSEEQARAMTEKSKGARRPNAAQPQGV